MRNVPDSYPRIDPPCPYFGICGGCTMQDLAYPDQLALKRERLARALAAVAGEIPAFELVGLKDPWRYRNRAEFTFGDVQGQLVVGYHVAGSFWRVVDLDDCLLLPAAAMRVVRAIHAWARQAGLPAYRPRTHDGILRHVLVRASRATGQVLACLVTAPTPREPIEQMAHELMAAHPEVSSVYWGISTKLADIALPDELLLLRGDTYLEEQVGPFRLRLAPFSFLQPSTQQAERMYDAVCAAAGNLSGVVVWDLYCGLGLVAFYLARTAGRVYGIDSEPQHLELAKMNAQMNGVRNVEFRMGRTEALLLERRFWLQEARPEVVVVDPPRAGLHPQAISSLLAARPRRLIYLSCNAQSLVQDLQALLTQYPRYRLVTVQAFDMFPQTDHLETVTLLERA